MYRTKHGELMSYKDAGKKGKEWGTLGIDHSSEGENVGRTEGSKTWHEATDEEKEQRKLAGRKEANMSLRTYLPPDRKK